MVIDRPFFFSSIRDSLHTVFTQSQVDGFNHLLGTWETDYSTNPLCYLAYALATAWHETARTMRPIEEIGRGAGHPYGPTGYWGRGYVQLTWKENYAKASKMLPAVGITVDLVAHPASALDPQVAAQILFMGMSQGWFSGRAFVDYLPHDPVGARRIINGTDRAQTVASYYTAFLAALRTVPSQTVDVSAEKPPLPPTASPAPHASIWTNLHDSFFRKA